jgi:hypothetical protein
MDRVVGALREKVANLEGQALSVRKSLKLPEGTLVVAPNGTRGVIGSDGMLVPDSIEKASAASTSPVAKALDAVAAHGRPGGAHGSPLPARVSKRVTPTRLQRDESGQPINADEFMRGLFENGRRR